MSSTGQKLVEAKVCDWSGVRVKESAVHFPLSGDQNDALYFTSFPHKFMFRSLLTQNVLFFNYRVSLLFIFSEEWIYLFFPDRIVSQFLSLALAILIFLFFWDYYTLHLLNLECLTS